MASIQQAMNQMLSTAGIAAGFYAHSPEGQRRAEIKQTKKAYNQVEELSPQWEEPTNTTEIEATDEIYEIQLARAKKLYNLDPTNEHYQEWLTNLERAHPDTKYAVAKKASPKAQAEAKAQASLEEKQTTKSEINTKVKKERHALLEDGQTEQGKGGNRR